MNTDFAKYGELIAVLEYVLKDKINPNIVSKMIANPKDQATLYWYKEAIKDAALSGDDTVGLRLAELGTPADYDIPTPAQQGTVQIGYYKTKGDITRLDARLAFGQKVRDRRNAKGLSTIRLAEMTGLQQAHIVRIEGGRYSVTLDTINKLNAVLGELI